MEKKNENKSQKKENRKKKKYVTHECASAIHAAATKFQTFFMAVVLSCHIATTDRKRRQRR